MHNLTVYPEKETMKARLATKKAYVLSIQLTIMYWQFESNMLISMGKSNYGRWDKCKYKAKEFE